MRIKSLKIPKYKNLLDIDLTFDSDLITLLVGQNGLGKSNLIEILSLIFRDLYILRDKKDFTVEAQKGDSFDYTIEYECHNQHLKVNYLNGEIEIFRKTEYDAEYSIISFAKFKREADQLLPDRIMGYYSGENRRIEKMLSEYTKKERLAQIKSCTRTSENRRMRNIFFSENQHSQLILFTLAVYWSHPTYGEAIDNIIKGTLDIDRFIGFELIFKNPSFAVLSELRKSNSLLEDYEGEILSGRLNKLDNIDIFWGIKGKVDVLLRLLLLYYISEKYSIYEEKNKEYFELHDDSFNDELLQKIFSAFPNPVDFFDALESCSNIGSLDKLTISASKTNNEGWFHFEAMSEGEQQLISVLGLMVILKDDNEEVLYLIDEPDTHINPLWQRDFVQKIYDNVSNNQTRHIFISTHSPFLVQAYDKAVDILLFRKNDNDDRIIIDRADHTIKNWRIDHVLMSPYFGLESTRPNSVDEFMSKRLDIIKGGEFTATDKSELEQLENELGFLPTGETLTELESMVYINKVAKKFKEEEQK